MDEAMDLVQDACIKIIEAKYDRLTLSLFYMVIRNLYINNFRRNRFIYSYNIEHIRKTSSDYVPNYEDKEFIQEILNKNNELSYYISGYKYDEIARIFKISLGALKSRIHKQREDIQCLMTEASIINK